MMGDRPKITFRKPDLKMSPEHQAGTYSSRIKKTAYIFSRV
jgi:hypothetical protein